jgi:hypothetical protein
MTALARPKGGEHPSLLFSSLSEADYCRKILEPYRKCAGAVQPGKATIVSRRGICDREIWTKPLELQGQHFPVHRLPCSS